MLQIVGSEEGETLTVCLNPLGPSGAGCTSREHVEAGGNLIAHETAQRRSTQSLADVLRYRNLSLSVLPKHKVVGVDGRKVGGVRGLDVDAAAGEGEKRPVLDGERLPTGGEDNFRVGDLGVEDQIILALESLYEIGFLDGAVRGAGDNFCIGGELELDVGS